MPKKRKNKKRKHTKRDEENNNNNKEKIYIAVIVILIVFIGIVFWRLKSDNKLDNIFSNEAKEKIELKQSNIN